MTNIVIHHISITFKTRFAFIFIQITHKRYVPKLLFKTACSAGFYGFGCKQKCGNCLDVNKCLHTNGVCLTGCDVGYQGELCNTRQLIFEELYLTYIKTYSDF